MVKPRPYGAGERAWSSLAPTGDGGAGVVKPRPYGEVKRAWSGLRGSETGVVKPRPYGVEGSGIPLPLIRTK